MQVQKEAQEKSQIKLTIEVSVEEFAPFQQKAAKQISESIDVPGFRKGQAPFDIIKQRVGEMTILQEAAQLAVQKLLPQAIDQEKLETVGQPQIGVEKLAPENPFIFTAILPIVPEVTIGALNNIKLSQEKVEVKEEDVHVVLENLREMRAKEVLAEREAKNGDKVEIDFNVYLDAVPVDGGASQKYPLVIGKGQMIPGFEDQLIGMKAGEEKEFKLTFPSEYHNKQLAGKEAEFKVNMQAVYDRELPEMDQAFVQEIGEYDSLDALKDAIEKNLFEEKEEKAKNDFERSLIEELVKISKFGDLPEVMVNRETQQMIAELEQNIARQGLKFDDYLLHLKKDRGQLALDFAPDAVKRIKSALVLRTVAKQQDLKADEAEVAEEINKQKQAYQSIPHMQQHLSSPEFREYVESILRNKKTIEWLKSQIA